MRNYRYNRDIDDTLSQVSIVRPDGRLHGILNWFAIHPTTMNQTNQLISSDNVGYAALALEKKLNVGALPGKVSVNIITNQNNVFINSYSEHTYIPLMLYPRRGSRGISDTQRHPRFTKIS
jgi:Tfp pilus assembly major pilin PilA